MMRRLILPMVALIFCLPALAADPELQWDFLRDATQKTVDNKPVMEFEPEAVALNGKQVTLHGWITPFNLGDGDTVTSFLLTGTPGTCPFCSGAQPQDFVLVTASEPIPVDITAELVLTGRFEVNQDDPTGFYYRLRDAKRK
jgi:hypothetical protein